MTSIQDHLHELQEILFDNSDNLKEGDYLKMMNISRYVFELVELQEAIRLIAGLIRPSRGVVCEMSVIQTLMAKIQESEKSLYAHLMAKTMNELVPIARKLCIPHSGINKDMLVNRICELFVEHRSNIN